MEDFSRRDVNCWHGNKLYECPNPEHSTPKVTASHVTSHEVVPVYYYRGTAKLLTNITDRDSDMYGASIEEYVTCQHRHKTWQEAEKCAERLGAREEKKRNQALEANQEEGK